MSNSKTKMTRKQYFEILEVLETADNKLRNFETEIFGNTEDKDKKVLAKRNKLKDEKEGIKRQVKTIIISVDCEENKEGNVEAGGPPFLGYDFLVEESKVEEMRHYISVLIKKHKQPLIRTYVRYEEELKYERPQVGT